MLHPPRAGKGMGRVVSLNQSANILPHLLLGGVSLGTHTCSLPGWFNVNTRHARGVCALLWKLYSSEEGWLRAELQSPCSLPKICPTAPAMEANLRVAEEELGRRGCRGAEGAAGVGSQHHPVLRAQITERLLRG